MMTLTPEILMTLQAANEAYADRQPSKAKTDAIKTLKDRQAKLHAAMTRNVAVGKTITGRQIEQMAIINHKLAALGAGR